MAMCAMYPIVNAQFIRSFLLLYTVRLAGCSVSLTPHSGDFSHREGSAERGRVKPSF